MCPRSEQTESGQTGRERAGCLRSSAPWLPALTSPSGPHSRFGPRCILPIACLVAVSFGLVHPAIAQPEVEGGARGPRTADEAVEAYMERLGLKRLMADELGARAKAAQGAERVLLAERLGKLFVELLVAADTAEHRRVWEDRARDLLKLVPESDTFDLRLSLAKAMYLQAEEAVERHRLRLASRDETSEAERVLRTLKPQLDEIATRVNRRVEIYEKQEEEGDSTERVAGDLAEARRVRSQAFYYAGWCAYYLAFLTGQDEPANDALKAFGWLLNSRGGKPASLDRLPQGLLKYEHVARAAIGCALATALKGNDTAAMRWLDLVEEEQELVPAVKEQLLARRITIAAGARRWADVERLVRVARKSDRSGGGPNVDPLTPGVARLLAIVTLEADKSAARDVVEPLASIALGDLVARSEVGQVLDLVNRYGTAPIGETGFIVHYVRGLQQYERARDAHAGRSTAQQQGGRTSDSDRSRIAAGGARTSADADTPPAAAENPDEPSRVPEVVNLYKQAAAMLTAAVGQDDAGSFKVERAKASMLIGMSLYYAGEPIEAAERFVLTAKMGATAQQAQEAMWLAVVALDYAVEKGGGEAADKAVVKRRDEAATLYLQTYPDTERAAKLLLRRAMTGALESEESVRILLGVPKDSPLYPAARQYAAKLLYTQFRAARGSEREFAAMRFVGVAEDVLAADRRAAVEGSGAEAAQAADRVVVRTRQILDALLSGPTPDVARAESALDVLTGVAVHHRLDLSAHQTELNFRRIQIALGKDDAATAATLIDRLQAEGGQFAVAADQLMYKRAATLRQRQPADLAPARDIVRYGTRIIDRMTGKGGGAPPDSAGPAPAEVMKDPVLLTLYETVAQAAVDLWDAEATVPMRDLAIRLDQGLLRAMPQSERPLRRLARTSEAAADTATALECWRTLVAGTQPPSPAWFEARYNSLRLLAVLDIKRAREVMRQHRQLYPAYGPEPWGEKLKELDAQMGPAPAPEPKDAPGPPSGGGGRGGGG